MCLRGLTLARGHGTVADSPRLHGVLGEAQKIVSLANDQSKEQKRGHPGSKKLSKEQSVFATLMDICHLERRYLALMQCSQGKTTGMRRTSSRCSISLHPGRNGRCPIVIENSSQNVQIFGCIYQKHKWPKSWSSMKDPVVPLKRNLYGHPLAGLLWERQFEKVLLEHGWEKVPNCECYL